MNVLQLTDFDNLASLTNFFAWRISERGTNRFLHVLQAPNKQQSDYWTSIIRPSDHDQHIDNTRVSSDTKRVAKNKSSMLKMETTPTSFIVHFRRVTQNILLQNSYY